jgi:hypothetical protein
MISSDWYEQRLHVKQSRDVEQWRRNAAYLERFLARASHRDVADELRCGSKLDAARQHLAAVQQPSYLELIRGTLGGDPLEPVSKPHDHAAALVA